MRPKEHGVGFQCPQNRPIHQGFYPCSIQSISLFLAETLKPTEALLSIIVPSCRLRVGIGVDSREFDGGLFERIERLGQERKREGNGRMDVSSKDGDDRMVWDLVRSKSTLHRHFPLAAR